MVKRNGHVSPGRRFMLSLTALALLTVPALAGETVSPLAEGKALFEKVCNGCHELDRSLGKKADRAGWKATIDRMVASGAELDEGQTEQVLGYLTAKSSFETKCNTCHGLDSPLASIKNPEEWKKTVVRMSAMKPGHITDAEAGAIVLYLSLVAPVK